MTREGYFPGYGYLQDMDIFQDIGILQDMENLKDTESLQDMEGLIFKCVEIHAGNQDMKIFQDMKFSAIWTFSSGKYPVYGN